MTAAETAVGTPPIVAPEAAGLVVEDRFAIVPEWLLDADISDAAIRLYAVLLRYGQSSGARMPGRATLARRLRKRSTDSVDRAMRELVEIGAVHIQHRYAGGQRLTNLYQLKAVRGRPDEEGGSRTFAATPSAEPAVPSVPVEGGGRTDAARGSRNAAAGVAATLRPNPEHLTQIETSSSSAAPAVEVNHWREEEDRFLASLGITDMDRFVTDVQALRADAGAAVGRWSRPPLVAALQAAVARGWPEHTAAALRAVAADPVTRSPMRLAEAGPWWDLPAACPAVDVAGPAPDPDTHPAETRVPLEVAEAELAETDGLRVVLQRTAREQLAAEGAPVTRITVLRRAHQVLVQTRQRQEVPA
ncbi:MAG: hypothetical protein QOJ11_2975 [Frankiales bacterium]|nr:hypothetical protein [Frankiales bacterium]